MLLYSLVDPKGCAARAAFDYAAGFWIEDGMAEQGMLHAQRVQDWARLRGIELVIEHRDVVGRIALHCPAAGRYWHPEGQGLSYYLEHAQMLKCHILQQRVHLRGQLEASTRELDIATISLLLEELDEYFRDGISHSSEKFGRAIAIARDALGRLGKC